MDERSGTEGAARWVGRSEDAALLTGGGRFSDDLRLPGQAIAVFLRSPHASARIRSLDIEAARAVPGVLAILTGKDVAALGNVCQLRPFAASLTVPRRPALALDRVRHIGESVAMVVAESEVAALEGAERIAVDYEELPALVDLRAAAAPDAPQIWPEAPGNVALDWPDPKARDANAAREIESILAAAPHVARLELVNQRILVASLEPRGATGVYDPAADSYTLHCCSQGASVIRDHLVAILHTTRDKVRVISGDVGGAFGMKTCAYPEYPALLVAARRLGRPVHWMSGRAESFLSDNQARGTYTEAALALDREGRFLALRVRQLADMGAYQTQVGAFIASVNFARCFPTLYHVPKIDLAVRCVFTNTVPTGPYRGAGRPEANYAMERLVEEAARISGIDALSLRRRNFIAPEMMPYKTPLGAVYDSGEFAAILDRALAAAGHEGFAARRRAAEAAGKRRGFGVSCFLEHAGGQPEEPAELAFTADGMARFALAVGPSGQGHATVFRRLAARHLGVPEDRIALAIGDSGSSPASSGTVASRSTMLVGSAVHQAAEQALAKGRRVASLVLEAAESDIEYAAGNFSVAGTDRRVGLFEVAARARELHSRGTLPETLDTQVNAQLQQSYPNGCHIAEVEIDPATGAVALVAYTAIDDCGNALDRVMIDGQVHGGIAQGVGQVLAEHAVYDGASGQLLSGTFMDYAMPRADLLPAIASELHPVPCATNPLGVKGVGEAGTTAALAAVMNAIIDAVPAARDLDMPITAEKLWRACRSEKTRGRGK